ncbi:MAG: hypothetical protein WAW97_07215, partial [Gemmiger qucibialis]
FGSLYPPLAALTFAASSIICAFGLASAAPRSPYRHLELCGIALREESRTNMKERGAYDEKGNTGSFSYHGGSDGGRRFGRLFFQRTGRHSQHGRYFQCRFHHSIQRGQR